MEKIVRRRGGSGSGNILLGKFGTVAHTRRGLLLPFRCDSYRRRGGRGRRRWRLCRRTEMNKNDNLFIYIVYRSTVHIHTHCCYIFIRERDRIYRMGHFLRLHRRRLLELHFVEINEPPLREMREINNKHLIIFFPSLFRMCARLVCVCVCALDTQMRLCRQSRLVCANSSGECDKKWSPK